MSTDSKLVCSDRNTLLLKGAVNFSTAGALFDPVERELIPGINRIDCNGIEEADSAAISLLLVCLRLAQDRDLKIRIDGLGEQLQNLARLYGVDKLLLE